MIHRLSGGHLGMVVHGVHEAQSRRHPDSGQGEDGGENQSSGARHFYCAPSTSKKS